MTVAIAMRRCPRCARLYAAARRHACVRDVNRYGLGDRRGVALERIEAPRYRPGTLRQVAPRVLWRVYVDGRPRLTTDREAEARELAEAIAAD